MFAAACLATLASAARVTDWSAIRCESVSVRTSPSQVNDTLATERFSNSRISISIASTIGTVLMPPCSSAPIRARSSFSTCRSSSPIVSIPAPSLTLCSGGTTASSAGEDRRG